MKLAHIHPGDLVEVNKGGRRMYGQVLEIRNGVVQFEPLCRGVSYRHASAREIICHWRRTGRRGTAPTGEPGEPEPPAVSRAQLSLGIHR